ncbi:MAG: flagellar biosynthesis regulator FlaF [Opitutales bacterium]|nr:flagellar biosynthesis regulator FlaF [Opitutales bacterium]
MQKNLTKLYRQTQMNAAGSGRQVEISILEMAAAKLRACVGEEEKIPYGSGIDEALRFNQKVWDVFCADWSDDNCQLEDSLRQNLLSIGLFVKKRTFTMLAQPTRSGVNTLIELNDNLTQGLKDGASNADAGPKA